MFHYRVERFASEWRRGNLERSRCVRRQATPVSVATLNSEGRRILVGSGYPDHRSAGIRTRTLSHEETPAYDWRLTENKVPGLLTLDWQKWVELMPFACLAFGIPLIVAAAFEVADPAFILVPSSALTILVGANEKNARQRSSRRRTASRTRRRTETLRLID
jgi:hypothetical protein